MKLCRVRDLGLARVVARGVRRYNGVSLSPRRVLTRPHFAIRVNGSLAGAQCWWPFGLCPNKMRQLCLAKPVPQMRIQDSSPQETYLQIREEALVSGGDGNPS